MILLLAACAARLGVPPVDYGESAPIPLVRTSIDPRWYVPMTIDGEPWVWFLDTGYSHTTCDDGLASALDLPLVGRATVKGELGRLTTRKTTLPDFQLGGHTVRGLSCQVRDLDTTSSIRDPEEVRVAGVLGMDVLRPFVVDVDPQRAEVVLHRPGEESERTDDTAVRLRRELCIGTRAQVPLVVGDDRRWIIVDTGATGTHLDPGRLDLTPSRIRRGVLVRGSGGSGADLRDLAYYDVALGLGSTVVQTELIGRDGRSGLLGLDVLGQLRARYDLPRGRAWFDPIDPRPVPRWATWRATFTDAPGTVMSRSAPPPP